MKDTSSFHTLCLLLAAIFLFLATLLLQAHALERVVFLVIIYSYFIQSTTNTDMASARITPPAQIWEKSPMSYMLLNSKDMDFPVLLTALSSFPRCWWCPCWKTFSFLVSKLIHPFDHSLTESLIPHGCSFHWTAIPNESPSSLCTTTCSIFSQPTPARRTLRLCRIRGVLSSLRKRRIQMPFDIVYWIISQITPGHHALI